MKSDFNMNGKNLDQELNSAPQQQMREVVQSLPEETVSLAWRSELNVRVVALAERKRRLDLQGWLWKPAVGVSVAGALALVFMAKLADPGPVVTQPNASVETALVGTYMESKASWEVAGDGATATDSKDATPAMADPGDWGQEDVGATL